MIPIGGQQDSLFTTLLSRVTPMKYGSFWPEHVALSDSISPQVYGREMSAASNEPRDQNPISSLHPSLKFLKQIPTVGNRSVRPTGGNTGIASVNLEGPSVN